MAALLYYTYMIYKSQSREPGLPTIPSTMVASTQSVAPAPSRRRRRRHHTRWSYEYFPCCAVPCRHLMPVATSPGRSHASRYPLPLTCPSPDTVPPAPTLALQPHSPSYPRPPSHPLPRPPCVCPAYISNSPLQISYASVCILCRHVDTNSLKQCFCNT